MSESKVAALKEALAAQQELLKKLYNDLDVEREAASTAASEALSMILRLQDEKAAVKMEAEQYKRLAEEKMSYAEETVENFENLVYQKEMEISALDFQVQAFKNKLLDIGFDDSGEGEIDFPENMHRSGAFMEETSTSSTLHGDFASLVPPPRLPFIKAVHEIEGSESPEDDLILKGVGKKLDRNSGLEKQNIFSDGNRNSYWEQIRKLEDRVREITGEPNMQLSRNGSCGTIKRTITKEYDHLKYPDNMLEKEVCTNFSSSSMIIHDVFEVPESPEDFFGGEDLEKKQGKAPLQDDEKGAKPHFISNKAFRQFLEGQDDCLDKGLISQHRELNLSPPPDGESVDCQFKSVQSTSACTDKIQQTNNLSEISEIQSPTLRDECTNVARVELQVLNEIQKQLNMIQSEIKSLKPKKSSSLDDLHIHCLKEELLHFWL